MISTRRMPIVVTLLLMSGAWLAAADDPQFVDQTLIPDMDARISNNDTESKGTADEFQSGFYPPDAKVPTEYRIVMHFDLSTLKKTPVRCAILRICNKNNTSGKNVKFMRLHALYRPWEEKKVTWYNNQPDDAWINKGGDFLPTCYGAASIPPKWGGEEEHYYSFDVTMLVQLWQNGTIKNHGLIIMHDAGSDNYQRFHSREYASNRPMLWISYSGTITSPDPTVMASNGIPPFGPAPDYKPHITTTTLNAASAGVEFKAQFSAKGGERPYKWELLPGSKLPEGISLSESGLLAGTATAPGAFNFRVKCSTPDRKYDQVSLKLAVQGEAAPVKPVEDKPKPADGPPALPPELPQDDG